MTWAFWKPIIYQILLAVIGGVFGVGATVGVQTYTSASSKPVIPPAEPVRVVSVPTQVICDVSKLQPQLTTIEGQTGTALAELRDWRAQDAARRAKEAPGRARVRATVPKAPEHAGAFLTRIPKP